MKLNEQTSLDGGKEFGQWYKGTCWNMTVLGKRIITISFAKKIAYTSE